MERIDSTPYYDHNAERVHKRRTLLSKPSDLIPFIQELEIGRGKGCTVLDWGCGSGIDLVYIEGAGHRAVGLEVSVQMMGLAKQNAPGATLILKNGLFYSPEPNRFDGVWMNASLGHLPFEQAQRVIATCFQGLKTNGILGIVVQEGQGFYEDREDDFLGPSRTLYLYDEKLLCSMIEQTGFQVIKVGRRVDQPGQMLLLARATSKFVK